MALRKIYRSCLIAACLITTSTLTAQTVNQFSGWGALFTTTRIDQKLSIHFDGQVRSTDEWKRVQTILLRPGLNYQVSKNKIATVGYAYIDNYRTIGDATGWAPEHRIWEQFIINQSFAPGGHFTTLQHRFRLEQRFMGQPEVDGDDLKTSTYHTAHRLRYFVRTIFPLKKTTSFKQGCFVSLQDEVMANLGKSPATNGKFFDQNRLYGSFGYRLRPGMDIEAGYMYQYVAGRENAKSNNNLLQLAMYTRF